MDFSKITNTTYSAIRANSELLNMDKDANREISYEQLEELKSIAESTQRQLVIMQKQIDIMEKQMENCEKENAASKKQSRISIGISIVAIVATFISAIIPKLLELLGL